MMNGEGEAEAFFTPLSCLTEKPFITWLCDAIQCPIKEDRTVSTHTLVSARTEHIPLPHFPPFFDDRVHQLPHTTTGKRPSSPLSQEEKKVTLHNDA